MDLNRQQWTIIVLNETQWNSMKFNENPRCSSSNFLTKITFLKQCVDVQLQIHQDPFFLPEAKVGSRYFPLDSVSQ